MIQWHFIVIRSDSHGLGRVPRTLHKSHSFQGDICSQMHPCPQQGVFQNNFPRECSAPAEGALGPGAGTRYTLKSLATCNRGWELGMDILAPSLCGDSLDDIEERGSGVGSMGFPFLVGSHIPEGRVQMYSQDLRRGWGALKPGAHKAQIPQTPTPHPGCEVYASRGSLAQ